MNYFELYPGDYRRDTARLSLAEHGAYLLLMADYYASEQPLPADLPALYRIVGAQGAAEQRAVRSVADQYFPVAEDGLRHNARADREIAKAQKRIHAARQNGAKGGRKTEPKRNPPANPLGTPAGTQWGGQQGTHSGEALQTPHAIHQVPSDTSSSSGDSSNARARTDDDEADLAGLTGIPEAVNRETLAQFVRHRRVVRKPLSVAGWLQIRERLLDLGRQGHDPNESLRQTMAAGLALPVTPLSPGESHAASSPRGRVGLADRHPRPASPSDGDAIPGTAVRVHA